MMKVRMDNGKLSQILQKILSVTEKKTNMPILSNTLIKASDPASGVLDFSVTDLEISLWTQVESVIEAAGTTTVPVRKLLDVVRELPPKEVLLESLPGNKLLVSSGRARFELPTIPPEDFPFLNFYQDTNLVPCDTDLLKKALNKTLYGIPTEDDPFSISGLFWHIVEPNSFRFVSSDGHRLAYFEIPAESFPDLQIGRGIILPRKGVQEIIKTLEKENEALLGIHENCLILKTPSTLLSIQLLEGEFPEYQVIIPDERPFALSVEWETLHTALKRVAVLTDQKWRHVRFIITKGALELDAGNPELGNANDNLDIEYEGEDFTIAFNVKYVLDTVQAIESPQVRFEWVDQYHGGVFLGSDDSGYLSLIMPMVV